MVREGVVETDVVTVLGEISMPSSSSASEGGSTNDFEEYEDSEERRRRQWRAMGERRKKTWILRAVARTLGMFWRLWCRGSQPATI